MPHALLWIFPFSLAIQGSFSAGSTPIFATKASWLGSELSSGRQRLGITRNHEKIDAQIIAIEVPNTWDLVPFEDMSDSASSEEGPLPEGPARVEKFEGRGTEPFELLNAQNIIKILSEFTKMCQF